MNEILKAIQSAGGSPYFVGGCVRDNLMGVESKDIDVEVFGLSSADLVSILSSFGKVDSVGASFGVIKLTTDSMTLISRSQDGTIKSATNTMTLLWKSITQ